MSLTPVDVLTSILVVILQAINCAQEVRTDWVRMNDLTVSDIVTIAFIFILTLSHLIEL